MARDPIEIRLFPLLCALDQDCATDNIPLEKTILDLRLECDIDEIALALMNIYAQADTRVVCERVLDALAALYDVREN